MSKGFDARSWSKSLSSANNGGQQPFFQPKLEINTPGDRHEREADRIADQVVSNRSSHAQVHDNAVHSSPVRIQRDEKDKTGDVLSEGVSVTYDQLKDQPGFLQWKEQKTKELKLKLWDSQPTELKAGVIGFGLTGAGILSSALLLDPAFRLRTTDFLQDTNVLLPLSLVPYSEYFPVSSFKYKLPSASNSPYTFETEFALDAWLKLMREKIGGPEIGLSVGIDSAYTQSGGFDPVTGGNIKLKLGGGIVNLSAYYNQALPPTPVMISNPAHGEPPIWMMRSLPGQLEENLPVGTGVFITVDVLRVPQLWEKPKPKKSVQRKENSSATPNHMSTPPSVDQTLSSGGGRQLEPTVRRDMERSFGQDFSHVHIKTDSAAAQSANDIQAKAYTSGHDIVFGNGQYRPETESGKRLLAHELVHVNQQTGIIKRKETPDSTVAAHDMRQKLKEGRYGSAFLALNDHLEWGGEKVKKDWLQEHEEIRLLFLKNLPADSVVEVYSVPELLLKPVSKVFAMIDCWYQSEGEKQVLYTSNRKLFDFMLPQVSPYTGQKILSVVERVTERIRAKQYKSDKGNQEFHELHLLAPTVDRKIRFYKTYEKQGLFDEAKKKFDPFTGLTKTTFEILTDTNEVDREKALQLYRIMKNLPEEQRRAFLDAALFSGSIEADKDAEKYYKKYYKTQYKALPHNWDFAFWPWNWGEAPFADRLTIDHAALMSYALNYEDKAVREFGFDTGISKDSSPTISDPTGERQNDVDRLIDELKDPNNFNNNSRLAILLAIAVRGGEQKRITDEVLLPKHKAGEISAMSLAIIESYGFDPKKDFVYRKDIVKEATYDTWMYGHILDQTLGGGKSGAVFGEQRGTFDLRVLQSSKAMRGSLGGLRLSEANYPEDDYYNTKWLDEQIKGHAGSDTLRANLEQTKGAKRTGKVFASIRDDIRQANIFAGTLPLEGLNYFSDGTLYRSGVGVLQGLELHLKWAKDTSESDNSIELSVDIANILLNHYQMVTPKSTLAIGQISIKGFRLKLTQGNLAAAKGFFLGLLKNADFTMNVFLYLLPNVLKLLPYTVMAMVEEFKGPKVRTYKDVLGEIAKKDFAAVDLAVTFTRLQVRDMYDTVAGFLDDITIADKKEDGTPLRQGIRVQETLSWTVDAMFDIKNRIKSIDEKIRAVKAEIAESDAAEKILKLESEKEQLMKVAAEKGARHESRDVELEQVRTIMKKLREENERLEREFNAAKNENPLYSPTIFSVLNAERIALSADLDYLENQYFEDVKGVKSSGASADRYKVRQRIEAFEAKYKSFDVRMAFRGVNLKGGGYVKDMVNDALKSVGFINPQLQGLENIEIAAVSGAFTVSSQGASKYNQETGIAVRNLHLPLITASQLMFKTDTMLITGGSPIFESVLVSVSLDFVKNPLDRDPLSTPRYIVSNLTVKHASFTGLQVSMGDEVPLLDFPATEPVEIWGLRLWDFDPDTGNINLRINDVKAKGTFSKTSEDKSSSQNIGFGIDTTKDNDTEQGVKPALVLKFNKEEDSIETKLNIGSAWIPSLDIQSPEFELKSIEGTEAIELTNLQADVKVLFAQEAKKDFDPDTGEAKVTNPGRPLTIDIRRIYLKEIKARGITARLIELKTPVAEGEKPKTKSVQEVTLPQKDEVIVQNIEILGLRILKDEEKTQLQSIGDDASIKVGPADLGGISYKEKSAKGAVLKSLLVHRGKFTSLTFEAIGRNGNTYSPKEFFKFFGKTRLEGLDASGTFKEGKTSATVGVKGKKDKPISVDYIEGKDGKPSYYKVRLPLEKVALPALHIVKDDHEIIIPKGKKGAPVSEALDVDVKINAYVDFDKKDKLVYDVYLDALSIHDLKVYGLEYHNKTKGIDVLMSPEKPLHIPNVKAGGFRFTSWKGVGVFGKKGGWVEAAQGTEVIAASVESIHAALTDGSFLAEKDATTGRSALDVNIESFGFVWDKDGNMFIHLGAISGGFPKMKITQTDPVTKVKTTTEIGSKDNKAVSATGGVDIKLGADKNDVIEATGLVAGGITITKTEEKGTDKSTTKLVLDSEALAANKVEAQLNADGSKVITISGIKGGKIDLSFIDKTAKGKSEKYITMPDKDAIDITSLVIEIDTAGNKKFTITDPIIKRFKLRIPSQEKAGDYLSVLCDAKVNGKVILGDGNFDKLSFEDPRNAFIGVVEDNVPVEVTNIHIEYKDTSPSKSTPAPPKTLTPDQQKLLDLERERDSAHDEMINTPAEFYHGDHAVENPDFWPAVEKWQKAKKAYDDHKAVMIAGAKKRAKDSMTKKYLDAVSGTATAKLRIFNNELVLNLETYNGEQYVEISQSLVDNLKGVVKSLIDTTVDMKFWRSKEMKAIGEGLNRWWISKFHTPTAQADIDSIANGNAFGVISLLLRDIAIWPGVLDTDKKLFGINLNIEGYWGLDITSYDSIGIGLCETQYKHPLKDNWYSLYGMIEHLMYVSPTLVSVAGQVDAKRMEELAKGVYRTESDVSDLGIGDAVNEHVNFIKSNLYREAVRLRNTIVQNIHGVDLSADVTLRPQEVIRELLKEHKAGTFNFSGKDSIDDLHIDGTYERGRKPAVKGSVGGGSKGTDPMLIPGGKYLSEAKDVRAEYGNLEIKPVNVTYDSDVLSVLSENAKISGLKFGFKK